MKFLFALELDIVMELKCSVECLENVSFLLLQ